MNQALNQADGYWTSLHVAAKFSDEEMIQLLLDWGADKNKREPITGKTPRDVAITNNRQNIAAML